MADLCIPCRKSKISRQNRAAWVSNYGVPAKISTDQGRQFESRLFAKLNKLMGTKHMRTANRTRSYHPQANGLIKRFHRTMKAAIKCQNNSSWTDTLPLILLGLRSAYKEDLAPSPAEMLYGTKLKLPGYSGEMFSSTLIS